MCAQDAPTWCDQEPNWDELREHAHEGCFMCKGSGASEHMESEAPSINMANANWRDITELLGLGREEGGSIAPSDAPTILRRALNAVNVSGHAARFARDEVVEQGRLFTMATSPESVRRRLMGVIEVLKYATEHNQEVVWA